MKDKRIRTRMKYFAAAVSAIIAGVAAFMIFARTGAERAYAAVNLTITLSREQAGLPTDELEPGDTVTAAISFDGGKDVTGMQVYVEYDAELEYVTNTLTEDITDWVGKEKDRRRITILVAPKVPVPKGELCKITFKVADDSKRDIAVNIKATLDSYSDNNFNQFQPGAFTTKPIHIIPAPSPTPTQRPTATPTERPTATPTQRPTATPTERPTATPTERPTATPTQRPTATPTERPTATPTERPTATPTERPAATPTQHSAVTPTGETTADPSQTAPIAPTGDAGTADPSQTGGTPAVSEPAASEPAGTPAPTPSPTVLPTEYVAVSTPPENDGSTPLRDNDDRKIFSMRSVLLWIFAAVITGIWIGIAAGYIIWGRIRRGKSNTGVIGRDIFVLFLTSALLLGLGASGTGAIRSSANAVRAAEPAETAAHETTGAPETTEPPADNTGIPEATPGNTDTATEEPTADVTGDPGGERTEEPTGEPTSDPTGDPGSTTGPGTSDETAPPESPTQGATEETEEPTVTPSETVTPEPTEVPTRTPYPTRTPTAVPEETLLPTLPPLTQPPLGDAATAGATDQHGGIVPVPTGPTPTVKTEHVEVSEVDTAYRLSDFIQTLCYIAYGLAALLLLAGLVRIIWLLAFKKDIVPPAPPSGDAQSSEKKKTKKLDRNVNSGDVEVRQNGWN